MKAKLNRDVTIQFRGEYPVSAKAGTHLEFVRNGSGTKGDLWAIPPETCDCHGLTALFNHDARYYYIWAPEDAIEVEANA